MRKLLHITVIVLCFATSGLAQTVADTTDMYEMSIEDLLNIEIGVSSAKAKTVFNTPSTVSVIDRKMIETYNFSTVSEALAMLAGVQVLNTDMYTDQVTMRGVLQNNYANKTLLMINGVPTWLATTGDPVTNRIDINDVERIEVLKGPASVLYGSNAYSGAVNIVLRNGDTNFVSGNAGVGWNPMQHRSNPNMEIVEGNFRGGTSVNYSLDKFKLFVAGQVLNEKRNPYLTTSARGKLYRGDSTYYFSENIRIATFNSVMAYGNHRLLFSAFQNITPTLGTQPSYVSGAGDCNQSGNLIDYKYADRISAKANLSAHLTYDQYARGFLRTPDRTIESSINGRRLSAGVKTLLDVTDKFNIEAGLEYESRKSVIYEDIDVLEDTLIKGAGLNGKSVYELSAMLQAGYTLNRLSVLGGIRLTNNELYGLDNSLRGTLVYTINDNNCLKLIYGQSFRAPSVFELYFDYISVASNVNLKPETSSSTELCYVSKIDNLFLQAIAYYTVYDNLIKRVPNTAPAHPDVPKTMYDNSDGFVGHGIELELKYQAPRQINFFVNYAYMNGNDNDKVKTLWGEDVYNYRFVPQHSASYGISRSFGNFAIANTGRMTSEVDAHHGDLHSGFGAIAPQFTTDLSVSYKHNLQGKNVRLHHQLTLKNVTNSSMYIPEYNRLLANINSFPTSAFGRRLIYSMSFKF